jgi:hypothetical protein
MTDGQVLVGKLALGDLISLTRQAAFALRATDPILADALTGAAAECELTVYAAPTTDRVCC